MFNNYFYSVFTSSDFVLPNMEELVKPTNLLSAISYSGLNKFIKHLASTLQTKKVVVLMTSDLQFFKLVPPLLYHLFLLLNNGVVSVEWKLHAITPVFKSGDKSNVKTSYRLSLC